MERLEIILIDIKKSKLDTLIFDDLKISSSQVVRSHFYNHTTNEDVEFKQVDSLQNLMTPSGTGNVFLQELKLGAIIKDVMMVFSFNSIYGDIVLNFPEEELFSGDKKTLRNKAKKIIESLIQMKNKYGISKVRIGIEPAADDDTCLFELEETVQNNTLEELVDKLLYQP
ncbi:hypothetical protein HXZ66_15525 [Bacillus sp. A116_S68]|nr:hypothetical protein HXZ66_15525 [Bacillus sp. A116_S68]